MLEDKFHLKKRKTLVDMIDTIFHYIVATDGEI